MKKMLAVIALCAACAVAAFAQQGTGGGAVADVSVLNVNNYVSYFGAKRTGSRSNTLSIPIKYTEQVSDDDFYKFSNLSGDLEDVDTELEFALLSYYSQPVVNIRPVDAQTMLPARNKTSEIQLAAWAAIELAVLRFTNPGSPSIGKYEGILHFIKGRQTESTSDDITQNEINAAVQQIVAATVDAEFKKPRGGYVPYDVYVNSGHKAVIDAIKNILAQFFLNPNNDTYVAVWVVYNHYLDQMRHGFNFAQYACDAFGQTLVSLSPELARKVDADSLTVSAAVNADPNVRTVLGVSLNFGQ
jgi:hypothetical protein